MNNQEARASGQQRNLSSSKSGSYQTPGLIYRLFIQMNLPCASSASGSNQVRELRATRKLTRRKIGSP